MKRALLFLLIGGAVWAVGFWFVRTTKTEADLRLARLQAEWQSEKADLEAALERARSTRRVETIPASVVPPTLPTPARRPSPDEIVAHLRSLPASSRPGREWRQAVYWFEELTRAGPPALPAIRGFLARNEDLDLDTVSWPGRGGQDRVPLEFAVPPSLRLGFFDVTRRMGGSEAESILVESLTRTARGVEVAYLSAALQSLAPNQYRDPALAAARALLASAAPASASPLDRYHREYLFGVLSLFGDNAFVADAQTQLVRADSQVDRGALKYLQQVLGAQAVPLVAQAYKNPLLTNSSGKEPLARLALAYAGADATATAFYQQTVNDPLLTRSHRKNLIEDLNQDGFADPKNLTPGDLPLITSRLQLIEQMAPNPMDDANAAALQEAYKDLINMRDKITGQKTVKGTKPM